MMPYTLAMGSIWFALALLVGLLLGWLLRSIVAKRQVVRAKSHNVEQVELDRLRSRIASLEGVAAERDRLRTELDERPAARETPSPAASAPAAADVGMAAAAAALGHEIERDDLKVIEGIGPNVEALCHGIGIRTWRDLATTEVSLLRTMLADAGARFETQDPATWPQQAALLAAERWTDFTALAQQLTNGRP